MGNSFGDHSLLCLVLLWCSRSERKNIASTNRRPHVFFSIGIMCDSASGNIEHVPVNFGVSSGFRFDFVDHLQWEAPVGHGVPGTESVLFSDVPMHPWACFRSALLQLMCSTPDTPVDVEHRLL